MRRYIAQLMGAQECHDDMCIPGRRNHVGYLVQRDIVQIQCKVLPIRHVSKRDGVRLSGIETALIEQHCISNEPVRAAVEEIIDAAV